MKLRRLRAGLFGWVGGGWGVAQLAGLVVAAGLAGPAAVAYSNANDGWQEAVRMEVARSAAIQEDVREVYGDEAPATLRVILDEQTAVELGKLGAGNRLAGTQRATSADAADNLRAAYTKYLPQGLAADPKYRTNSGGADVIARLRDLRQAEVAQQQAKDEQVPDPAPALRSGDASAARGRLLSSAAALVSLAVAGLALVYYRPRHRRPVEHSVADLVEQPRLSAPGSHRRTATVILALWAAGAVLPLSQLVFGAEEQRSQAASARLAATLTTDIAVSNARAAFMTQSRQTARELGIRAAARRDAAAHASRVDAADQRAVADAEERAANTVERIAIAMSRAPVANDRLEPRMVQALTAEPDDWSAALTAQNAQAARANRWGGWSNDLALLIMVVTGMAAFAGVHHKHAGEEPQRRRRAAERADNGFDRHSLMNNRADRAHLAGNVRSRRLPR